MQEQPTRRKPGPPKKIQPPCSVEGCTRSRRKREWCHTHYELWRRTGSVVIQPRTRPMRLCSVEGCGRKHSCRGYCAKHATTWRRYGDPKQSPRNVIHAMTASPTYRSWAGMVTRCTNPKASRYDRYGGRGISVCDRWRTFANFLADMGERPAGVSPNGRALYSIDRIDPDGNYEPGNCRWATQAEQMANIRRS